MIVDKYTKHSIFSLPLIFDDILTKVDLKANGFVNMYMFDINCPLASNHIFLAFTCISATLLDKFKKHPAYFNYYTRTIDTVLYTIVVFNRGFYINFITQNTEKGLYYEMDYHSKMRIIDFWNSNTKLSKNLHSYLFNPNAIRYKPLSENITLEDKKSRSN